MSKNITSLLLPTADERRVIRKDKDHGLELFLENRMLDNAFMSKCKLDDLRIAAKKLYKGQRFQDIWDDTSVLVKNVKSTKMEEYGEKWTRVIRKHSDDRHEELRFYFEALRLNQTITMKADDPEYNKTCKEIGCNNMWNIHAIRDAGLIYNLEYLDPPLNIEEFNHLWYESDCHVVYIEHNNLGSCFCTEHIESEGTKLYNVQVHNKIAEDFHNNALPRLDLLYFLEGKIEDKSLSVEQIRKSFLEHNGRGLCNDIKLSPHTLNSIWEVAVNRAPLRVQQKIASASHGRMEKCADCGVEHDINTMELRTKDGIYVS